MLETTLTVTGNHNDKPNLKVTPTGAYVCSFRLASTPRRYDRKEDRWVDGRPLFLTVVCWRRLAEHVAASLAKGDRAMVHGRLQQDDYENAQGERRRRYEIQAEAVGLELTWHPARINRAVRGDGTMAAQPGAPDAASGGGTGTPSGGPASAAADGLGPLPDAPWTDGEPFTGSSPVNAAEELTGEMADGWATGVTTDEDS
jgi:single-strand DNA-binding protein